jgi:hypothetical protein
MKLKKIGCIVMDWIQLAYDSIYWWAVVDMVINLWVP